MLRESCHLRDAGMDGGEGFRTRKVQDLGSEESGVCALRDLIQLDVSCDEGRC